MFCHWSSRASCCAVCCCTFVVLLERCCTCHRCDLTAVTVRDFNEVMKNRGKVGLPLQSGVLYLDSCGGPTVVLNTELDLPYNASIDDNFDSIHPEHRRAHTAFLAQPVRNSFLVFPSKYMHGVLPRLEADQLYARRSLHSSSCMRTTFLINWWGNDLGNDLGWKPYDFSQLGHAECSRVMSHKRAGGIGKLMGWPRSYL